MNWSQFLSLLLVTLLKQAVQAFMHNPIGKVTSHLVHNPRRNVSFLRASSDEKAVKDVTGEELEIMLTEWGTPLLVDAYATW